MTFEVGDIAQWGHHPADGALVGTLCEIIEVFPPGDPCAFVMTRNWTEAAYDVIDCRGSWRGACHSWLCKPPPVTFVVREAAHET